MTLGNIIQQFRYPNHDSSQLHYVYYGADPNELVDPFRAGLLDL